MWGGGEGEGRGGEGMLERAVGGCFVINVGWSLIVGWVGSGSSGGDDKEVEVISSFDGNSVIKWRTYCAEKNGR